MQTELEIGVTIRLYKGGDKMECKNYRGITLISTVVKIIENCIERRIRKQVEGKMEDSQSGFRLGRSVNVHINTFETITNRRRAVNKDRYLAFIDMGKAFDKVPRGRIWESQERNRVSKKLINLGRMVYRMVYKKCY